MGGQIAKELGVYNEEERVLTPVPVGPQRYRRLDIDPRSPGIARTPIQVECTPKNARTGHLYNLDKTDCSVTEDSKDGVMENSISSIHELSRITLEESMVAEHSMDPEQSMHSEQSMDPERSIDHEQSMNDEQSMGRKPSIGHEQSIGCEPSMDHEQSMDSEQPRELATENVAKDKVSESLPKYLETNIDSIDSPLLKTDQLSTDKGDKTTHLLNLPDVRSPSFHIARTPVLVECTPELFALHSRIDSLSFCDFDVHEDPSAVVSEDDQSYQHNQSSVNHWLDSVENSSPLSTSIADSPKTVARKQRELNAMKKQLFFTPDIKTVTTQRARTPLGDIQASQRRDSPQQMIRTKQWRNIQEERQRRGIADTENTPPNLPPLPKISSAPGKMLERKRTKMTWDEENALLI